MSNLLATSGKRDTQTNSIFVKLSKKEENETKIANQTIIKISTQFIYTISVFPRFNLAEYFEYDHSFFSFVILRQNGAFLVPSATLSKGLNYNVFGDCENTKQKQK